MNGGGGGTWGSVIAGASAARWRQVEQSCHLRLKVISLASTTWGVPRVKCGGVGREGRGVCFLNSTYVGRTSKSYKGGVYSLESLLYASKLPILEGACTLKAA